MKIKKIPFFVVLALAVNMILSYASAFSRAVKRWVPEGVPVTGAVNNQLRSDATEDGAGGIIVVWEDWRDDLGNGDIFGQRINANGDVSWPVDGVPIATACFPSGLCTNSHAGQQIIGDGAGGAIIAWHEVRDGFNFSVWAQRVNANGTTAWTLDGEPVAYGSFYADFPKIVSDGDGGAIIAWQDSRSTHYQIFAQRLDGNGTPQWTLNGIRISQQIGLRGSLGHSIASHESGGALIVWVDRRDPNGANIYVQKIDTDGQILWQEDGVQLSFLQGDEYDPAIISDGRGGAIITWEDGPASPPGSGQQWIMAQRVDATGTPRWTAGGIPVGTFQGYTPKIIGDGIGGAFIVWNGTIFEDNTISGPTVFAQHLTGNGTELWTPGGFIVYREPQGSYGHVTRADSDGAGGVIVHWQDYRHTGFYWDLYAQRLSDMNIIPILQFLLSSNQ